VSVANIPLGNMANTPASFGGSFFVLLYYLPIYFQSVDGVSASKSGVDNIPLVLGVCKLAIMTSLNSHGLTVLALCTVISGGLITAYGIYVPWLFIGSILSTIGTGLIYTLDIGSSSSKWIGYQALAGIGIGFAFQVPMIANQAFVKMSEISSVTAVTLCEFNLHLL